MTGHKISTRPASAAIAAVLALTATPLLAQTAVTPPAAPVTPPAAPALTPDAAAPAPAAPMMSDAAPAPQAPAAPTPQFTPGQPVVQSTPPVDERIAAATAAVEAEKASAPAARPAAIERAAPARTPERPVSADRTAAATPAVTPVQRTPAAAADPAPVAPVTESAADVVPATTLAEPAMARTDQALYWALGGGALLLLGLGGAALVRRRRPDEDVADAAPVYTYAPATMPLTPTPVVVAPAAPSIARPAMAPASQRVSEDATLDAMVAAAPSAENPFRTRTKRLRRAQYLLAHRDAAPAAAAAPQTVHAEPAPAPALDRSQTVYRFGNQSAPSGFLKPRPR